MRCALNQLTFNKHPILYYSQLKEMVMEHHVHQAMLTWCIPCLDVHVFFPLYILSLLCPPPSMMFPPYIISPYLVPCLTLHTNIMHCREIMPRLRGKKGTSPNLSNFKTENVRVLKKRGCVQKPKLLVSWEDTKNPPLTIGVLRKTMHKEKKWRNLPEGREKTSPIDKQARSCLEGTTKEQDWPFNLGAINKQTNTIQRGTKNNKQQHDILHQPIDPKKKKKKEETSRFVCVWER